MSLHLNDSREFVFSRTETQSSGAVSQTAVCRTVYKKSGGTTACATDSFIHGQTKKKERKKIYAAFPMKHFSLVSKVKYESIDRDHESEFKSWIFIKHLLSSCWENCIVQWRMESQSCITIHWWLREQKEEEEEEEGGRGGRAGGRSTWKRRQESGLHFSLYFGLV